MQYRSNTPIQFFPQQRRSITPNSRALIEQNFQFGNFQLQQVPQQRSTSQTKVLAPHLSLNSAHKSAQIPQINTVQKTNKENTHNQGNQISQQQQQLKTSQIRGRNNEIIITVPQNLNNSNQTTYRLKQSTIDDKSSQASIYQGSNQKQTAQDLMMQTCPSAWNLNQQQTQYQQNQKNPCQAQQQQQAKFQQNISKLLLENEKLNQLLCDKDKEFAKCKKKLQQLEKKNETYKKIISTHDKEVQNWQEKFEQIETKFLKFVQENSSHKAEEENKSLKEQIAQLNKQNEDLNELIFKNIKSQISDSNEIKQLKTQIQNLESIKLQLNNQITEIQSN